ncbi:CHAT domain-containing protein [Tirmania nivea]|nr:CHAT domain-containing protein [Tirmania nivea]
MEDLEAAITRLQVTVEATPEAHPDRAKWLNNLGNYLSLRYEQTGDLLDLDAAINRTEKAVKATPADHPKRAGRLNNLGYHFHRRYQRTGNLDDLGVAINYAEASVKATPENHPDKAAWLNSLGYYLHSRYQQSEDLPDLEAAIDCAEAAVKATPEDHPERVARLNNLGSHLSSRYKRTGNSQDMDAAISHGETAVNTIPEHHPDRAGWLNNLGSRLISRYERYGNLQDLEAAINHTHAAVKATSVDHSDYAARLSNLGSHLRSRYERTGVLQDLEAAIDHTETAVKASPENHPIRPILLNNLGIYFNGRYEKTGDVQDLEAAISHAETAVKATPDGHPDRATWLHNLGGHLSSKYKRDGDIQDLEAATNHTETAVVATPDDHPIWPVRAHNLGNYLSSRYDRAGNLQDLLASMVGRITVKATPEDHPDRAARLNSLGNRFHSRYERNGNLQDLETAISHAEAAIKASPEDHPDRPMLLTTLGIHLKDRYKRTRKLQDLEAAISLAEKAMKEIPQDHPDHAAWLHNLGNRLHSRFERTGNLEDLETAIKYAMTAVKETPEDHPDRAAQLNSLGSCLRSRYRRGGDRQDLELAIAAWFSSWSIQTALILTRIQAASAAAYALIFAPAATSQDFSRACSLLHDATHLIPLATLRSLGREDQQHILGKLTGLVSLAAAVSLQAGQSPLQALRLQELGRSVTNGQLLDYRSDISNLMEKHPTLANDFDSLRQELDVPFSPLESSDTAMNKRLQIQAQQSATRRRNNVSKDLEVKLKEIREKPGFETFLRAESEEYLLSTAQEGPIVVLNATELRSDAILVTEAQVTSITLPDLSYASVGKYLGTSTDDNEVKREMLEWLWKAAVQPVLRKLGFYPKQVDPLPRIWWIGVGLLAQAPIHAAAKFTTGTVKVKVTTIQYCLPSYTSTIRALKYSRSHQHQQHEPASILVVTMPTTPGAGPLSGVIKEADGIKNSLQNLSTVEVLEKPTAECVLQALSSHSYAHFACHGVSSRNPADSHLLPVKGTDVDKLRVEDIAALKLPAPRLAYLSACNTANSTTFMDEVTHIVSSFHIAGFVNVIGTLWPAEDEACHKMAVDFYTALRKTDNVAASYRNAILALMKQKPAQPLYWAPFIHFGA